MLTPQLGFRRHSFLPKDPRRREVFWEVCYLKEKLGPGLRVHRAGQAVSRHALCRSHGWVSDAEPRPGEEPLSAPRVLGWGP